MVRGEIRRRPQVEQAVIGPAFDDPPGQFSRCHVIDFLLDDPGEFAGVQLHKGTTVRLAENRQRTECQGGCSEFLVQGKRDTTHLRLALRRSTKVAAENPATATNTTVNTTSPQGTWSTSGSVTWPIASALTKDLIEG
jgi:hypothetical protein